MFVERMMANGGQGLDVMLTPAQQQEFWIFLEEKRTKELLTQEKRRRDLATAGLSGLGYQQQGSSLFGNGSGTLSSALFGGLSAGNEESSLFSTTNGWNGGGVGGIGGSGLFDTPIAFPSQFQPPMTHEQYLKRNRQPSNRRH
jgi:hypothetical protein